MMGLTPFSVVTVRALAAAAAAAVVALTCEALLPDGLGSLILGVGLAGSLPAGHARPALQ